MSEQEKIDFVSGKFLYAITDFSLFNRGEAYWLEYIGNDTYCCRSDNRLNEKIRIKPWELERYFSEEPLHSIENILSEFAYHVRTWGLTDGESNEDFCNVEAHRCAKEIIKAARKKEIVKHIQFTITENKTDFGKVFHYRGEGCKFALYFYDDDRQTMYLSNLYVNRLLRGHGIGNRLLKDIQEEAVNLGAKELRLKCLRVLWVHSWYERNGFVDFPININEDYVWMYKQLK